jgi:hypothetical protein
MIHEILSNHYHTLADLADAVGINYNAIRPYLHQQTGSTPITRGIHKSKAYRGKVYCFVNQIEVKGEKYPIITFGTHKHGGYRETFNGYREHMVSRGYPDNYIQKQHPRQPKQEYIAPIESLEKWQIDALNAARKAFDAATNANVSTHDYIVKKGLNVADCDIRRGIGKYGDCLMIAVVDSIGAVIGYQQIYAQNIKGKDTNKYFIGRTGGGFVVIGNKSEVKNGAIYCEGLATGLKIYHSEGATKGELQNNRQTPVIVCLSAGNMRNVVSNHASEYGADNIKPYADNDCGKDSGNAGIFVALEICKENGIKKYRVPISEDSVACDFADTLKFKDFGLPKKRIDYAAEVLKVCPKQSIKRYWQQYAYALIENAPSELRSVDDCVNAVTTITNLRGIDVEKPVRDFICYEFKKQRERIRKLKTITDFKGITRFNVDGKSIADIATIIEFETLRPNGVMSFDNRGMGGNKTNTMVELSRLLKGSIAYISPLTAVCKNSGDRLGFFDYQTTSAEFINAHSRKVNLSVCINSIEKYKLAQNFTHLFIDEAAAVYAAIFDDTGTNKHQQQKLVDNLRVAIQSAKSVLIADAGLSDIEIAFFKSLAGNKQINLIETTPKPSDKNHWLLKNHSHAHELILRDITNGKCGVIACDTVAAATGVYKYLKNHGIKNQIDINRVLLATGENCGEEDVSDFIEKPNDNAYRYDVVIHSPIIRSGTSIEFSGYSFAYLLYDGVVGTSDAMQMLGRNRCATDVYVSFGNRIDKTRVTDSEMLLNADIELHKQQGYVLADYELARLRHEFTTNKNADLNDYKNNFMLFAEITGRNFTRIETDIELDAKFKKDVKEERIYDRLNSKPLTKVEYTELKNPCGNDNKRTTQAEHDAIKRYETAIMVYGEENITSNSVITYQDIKNEMDGMVDVLEKFELIGKDTAELKELDNADSNNRSLKYSRVQLQNALNEVLKPVLAANEKGGVSRKDFNKTCDKLEKHAPILALAGLGNYKKINRIRTGATVGNFVEKIGYRIKEIGQKGTGKRERIFEIKPIDDISRYAMNRKGYS